MEIYDSLYTTSTTKICFQPLPGKKPLVEIIRHKQICCQDCSIFAIALVTAVLHEYNPVFTTKYERPSYEILRGTIIYTISSRNIIKVLFLFD